MKKIIFPIVIVLFFYSCENKIDILNTKQNESIDRNSRVFKKEIKVHNGILEFDSFNDLDLLNKDLIMMKKTERQSFGRTNNFKSLQEIFEEIVNEEAKIFDLGDNLPNKTKENLIKYGFVSDLGITNKDIFKRDKETGIEKNINIQSLAYVVNLKGFVKIGDDFYKFEKDKIGIYKNINDQPNSTIQIKPSKNSKVLSGDPNIYNFSTSTAAAIGSPQTHKVLGYWSFTYNSGSNAFPVVYRSEYRIKALKRGFAGYWYNWNTDLEITGGDHFGEWYCDGSYSSPPPYGLTCGCDLDKNGEFKSVYGFVSGYSQVSEFTIFRNVPYDCYGSVVNNYWAGSIPSNSRSANITYKAGYPAGSPYVYTIVNANY